jgi:hypothetical protein
VSARLFAAVGILAVTLAASVGASAPSRAQDASSSLRTLVLTEAKTQTAGDYTVVDNASIRYGEELHVYGEPENFGWSARSGTERFNVVADVELRKRDGRTVATLEPKVLNYDAPTRPDNFFFAFSLRIKLPLGSYQLAVKLRDTATGQVIERSFPFTVTNNRAAPTAQAEARTIAARDNSTADANEKANAECLKYLPQLGRVVAAPCEK